MPLLSSQLCPIMEVKGHSWRGSAGSVFGLFGPGFPLHAVSVFRRHWLDLVSFPEDLGVKPLLKIGVFGVEFVELCIAPQHSHHLAFQRRVELDLGILPVRMHLGVLVRRVLVYPFRHALYQLFSLLRIG